MMILAARFMFCEQRDRQWLVLRGPITFPGKESILCRLRINETRFARESNEAVCDRDHDSLAGCVYRRVVSRHAVARRRCRCEIDHGLLRRQVCQSLSFRFQIENDCFCQQSLRSEEHTSELQSPYVISYA